MGRRSATARFMANAWVFPGGRVDDSDRERAEHLVHGDNAPSQLPWILAALRETVEEAGIWLTDHGLRQSRFIRRSGAWDIGRTGHATLPQRD